MIKNFDHMVLGIVSLIHLLLYFSFPPLLFLQLLVYFVGLAVMFIFCLPIHCPFFECLPGVPVLDLARYLSSSRLLVAVFYIGLFPLPKGHI